MTKEAQRLFLAARPKIRDEAELGADCRRTSSVHALGCLVLTKRCRTGAGRTTCSRQTQIYLLDIPQADLRDLMNVAAAHEVLHAAYTAMPDDERERLDQELEAALGQLDQCRVSARLGAYSGRVGERRLNELHSILATEFASLSASLETHYSKYFSNRQRVVDADRVLGDREKELCGLEARLDRRDARIAALERELQRLRSSGNVPAHNARVPAFNAQVNSQRRLNDTYTRKVGQYNELLASLGSRAGVLQQRQATEPPPQ